MKSLSRMLLVVLMLQFSFFNYSCSTTCNSALCDLITEVVLGTTLTVVAGQPFNVPNLIKNIPETVEQCKGDILQTLSANASNSRLKIDYDVADNGSFAQNELNKNFEVPEIPAGGSVTEGYSFAFDNPGVYRLITFADVTDTNDERDEDNNESAPENLSSGRVGVPVKSPLIIYVLPNPDVKYKAGDPMVRILGRTVTVN